MMVTLRLYRQHDLDLITLYRHPSFSLPAAIKRSLIAYVRKEQLTIKQPEPFKLGDEKISKTVQMHIQLDEEKDADVIKWIKSTKEGYRNSVLKNIIRGYLAAPCIYSYQTSTSNLSVAVDNNDLYEANVRNLTEIKGRASTTRKSKAKKDNRKVEDSKLASEILNRQTVKSENTGTVFIERIDDDDVKVPEVTKIEKPIIQTPQPTPQLKQESIPEETGDDMDMFDVFDDLMKSM